MGVPVGTKYHSGSQGHVSAVTGQGQWAAKGSNCDHSPPCRSFSCTAGVSAKPSSGPPATAGQLSSCLSPLPGAGTIRQQKQQRGLSSWTQQLDSRGRERHPGSCRPLSEVEGSDLPSTCPLWDPNPWGWPRTEEQGPQLWGRGARRKRGLFPGTLQGAAPNPERKAWAWGGAGHIL